MQHTRICAQTQINAHPACVLTSAYARKRMHASTHLLVTAQTDGRRRMRAHARILTVSSWYLIIMSHHLMFSVLRREVCRWARMSSQTFNNWWMLTHPLCLLWHTPQSASQYTTQMCRKFCTARMNQCHQLEA